MGGSVPVTVHANDLAAFDLGVQALDAVTLRPQPAHVGGLSVDVVELENEWIAFTTVHAGVGPQMIPDDR
jgi:hypothetical protein